MKKTITLIALVLTTLFFFTSCKKENPYERLCGIAVALDLDVQSLNFIFIMQDGTRILTTTQETNAINETQQSGNEITFPRNYCYQRNQIIR